MRIAYTLLLLLQASTAPVVYDTQTVTQACDRGVGVEDAIIVCGRRNRDKFRIPPLPPAYQPLPTARTRIGGAIVGVETERGNIGGISTNRILAKVKIPL